MLLAGWKDLADRITLIGIGAEKYSERDDGRPHGLWNMVMCWKLKPGEKKSAWAVRPYNKKEKDAGELRKHDWNTDWEAAEKIWQSLLFAKTTKYHIPDEGVLNGFFASFADLFIMREPLNHGYIGSVPGTEGYRAANSAEPAIVAIALDQQGLHEDAFEGYKVAYENQGDDGDWNDPSGWAHLMWCHAGFKSWAAIEHYRLTQDQKFLEWIYPRMLACARWSEKMRAYSRKPYEGEKPLNYGFMPRGMGDCGLWNDKDYYGIFIPHNIWSVYSSLIAADVAQILGKTEYQELKGYADTAYADLLETVRKGSIQEDGYRRIPGVAGKTSGSTWGALNIAFPCRLISGQDELLEGTLKHIEKQMSPGGMPVHTGWMANGMWAAITLDNIAETHLLKRNGDTVAKYFYATLNHGTPLYTWCEERGQEPNTTECSGDRQHLWTPVAVVRALRDMMVFEDYPTVGNTTSPRSSLQLALGIDREWLGNGNEVGVDNAPTHFGTISYSIKYNTSGETVSGSIRFANNEKYPKPEELVLNIRLPGGRKAVAVQDCPDATIAPNSEAVIWKNPKEKTYNFVIKTTL
jgi:hypothetical protein